MRAKEKTDDCLNLRKEAIRAIGRSVHVRNEKLENGSYSNKYVQWLEDEVLKGRDNDSTSDSKLDLCDVSKAKRLLIAYHKHNTILMNDDIARFIEKHVDDYLSN